MGGKPHGYSRSKVYRAWQNSRDRCLNPNNPAFHNYGARGISMDPAWAGSFLAFLRAVGEPPTPAHTLERLDNSRGYEPGNVQWATRREQANNQRKNRLVTAGGRTMTLAAWAREIGMAPSALHYRMTQGWTDSQIVLTPPHGKR